MREYHGWMRAFWWSRCPACGHVIPEGAWQRQAQVPDIGLRWVHEACAVSLGVSPRPADAV